VRRAVDDEVPGAVEEEAGPAAVRRVPPGLLDARFCCIDRSNMRRPCYCRCSLLYEIYE